MRQDPKLEIQKVSTASREALTQPATPLSPLCKMIRVFRRTVLAERQHARRNARRKDKNLRDNRKTNREEFNASRRDEIRVLKEARLNRREDYELGPIAPRRDVGDSVDTYGTIDAQRQQGPKIVNKKDRAKLLEPWGGIKRLNIVKGDRVVLLQGKDKGRIGVVGDVSKERAEVQVKGLNLIDVAVPEWMRIQEGGDNSPVRTVEKPVPINTVRLVVPLKDNTTGLTRDVIVKKVVSSSRRGRKIPGLDINIPWPPKERVKAEDKPGDTLRIDVERKTFVPTLLRPPMPGSVIDELRNKYSVFRTRHEPEYIAAKDAEEKAKEDRKKSIEKMRTPLGEINRQVREQNRMKGKGSLSDEMLEKIGKMVARKRNIAVEAEEVSENATLEKIAVSA